MSLVFAVPEAWAATGYLTAWGTDYFGQVILPPAGTFSAVSAGLEYNVAIRADNQTLVAWGYNVLASGTPEGTFSAVDAGSYGTSAAIRTDGSLVVWGNNDYGQVSGTPAGTFTAVAAGDSHMVALRTDGTLVSWGNNDYGQVSGTPTGQFLAVAAGGIHSVAIKSDGTLVSWGDFTDGGQLSVTPPGIFSAVAAGDSSSVGLRMDGTLISWGYDEQGVVSGTPTGTFTAVDLGRYFGVALRSDGKLVSWGDNSLAEVSDTPQGTFYAVSAGAYNGLAIGPCPQLTLSCPGDISVPSTDGGGMIVNYPEATTSASCSPTVAYSQASGTLFKRGPTTVTVTATDSVGNIEQCEFTVTVTDILVVLNNNDSGAGSLRQAIADALPGDTITFDPALTGQTITLSSGEMVIDKHLTITGLGANQLAISGGRASRIFQVTDGVNATIQKLTLRDGWITGNSRIGFSVSGGAIVSRGNLTVSECDFTANSANGEGGAIYNEIQSEGGNVTVNQSTFTGNSAGGYGGAIRITSSAYSSEFTVNQSTFTGNSANASGGAINSSDVNLSVSQSTFNSNSSAASVGGAIVANGGYTKRTVNRSTFNGNSAIRGGAIFTGNGEVTVSQCVFINNAASSFGGGFFGSGGISSVNDCLFSGCSALRGGGIYGQATISVGNTTFSDNSALTSGGAINFTILSTAKLQVNNCTLVNNSAPSGGGIYQNAGPAYIKNTLVAASPSGGNYVVNQGTLTVAGVNLSDDASCPDFTQVTTAALNLGPLADNGGPTLTRALLPGSVAIDAATDCTDWAGNTVSTDQRGVNRPQGAGCDVGAFELIENAPVARCRDVRVFADASCSASASIDNGSYDPDPGDTITVSQSPAGPYPVGLTTVTLTVTDSRGATSSCLATVTVVDNIPPTVVSCPTDVTIEGPATPAFGTPRFSDLCDNNLSVTPADSSLPVSGKEVSKTRRTWTATDHSGNSVSCSQTITVVDTTAPTIRCPADVTINATSAGGANVNYPAATATDTCSPVTITYSKASGSVFNPGTTIVTATATDAKGNSAQCTFKVNVVYSWSGVLQPINADGSSVFKLGSTVEVKFQLTDGSAGITDAVAKLGYVKQGSTVSGAVNEATSSAKPTTGDQFSYDPKTKQYYFNWGTKGLTSGTYVLQIKLSDGVSRTVKVGLK